MDLVSIPTLQPLALQNLNLRVEAVCHTGTQNFSLTGLPDAQLKDSRDKIRSLIFRFCPWNLLDRIVVNLEPADLTKSGSHLELPIFLSVAHLLLSRELDLDVEWPNVLVAGSLDLEGRIHHTPFTKQLMRDEAEFLGAHNCPHVSDLIKLLNQKGNDSLKKRLNKHTKVFLKNKPPLQSFSTKTEEVIVEGRLEERLALICAAIGKLPVLLLGSPGVGKSHLAKWAASILPPPKSQTQNTLEKIWSAFGMSYSPNQVPQFFPHSKTHIVDFIGRKRAGKSSPGYFSLSHGGILVLDEFPELARDAREIFRVVLESRTVDSFNSGSFIQWPANFWFLATANPCPCGYAHPRSRHQCQCSFGQWKAYQQRLSGPLINRFAIKLFLGGSGNDENEEIHQVDKEVSLIEKYKLRPLLEDNSKNLAQLINKLRIQFENNISKETPPSRLSSHPRSKKLQFEVYKILRLLELSKESAVELATKWNSNIGFTA